MQKILKGTKLNSNVNEFVPQNHGMIFIPVAIPPPFPLELPSVMLPIPPNIIPPIESSLNADVPEFHPRDYVQKVRISEAVEEKHNDTSKSTETCIGEKAYIITESNENSMKSCIVANLSDAKSRAGAIELISEINSRNDSQKYSMADLDDKHPTKRSNNNIIDIIDDVSIHKKTSGANITVISSAKPMRIFVETEKMTAASKKAENAERTYAQMLALTKPKPNPSVPTQTENRKYFEKSTGKTANYSKVKQSAKSKSKRETFRILTAETVDAIEDTSSTLTVGVSEWYTVRSKCRKKNPLNEEVDFESNTYGAEEDYVASIHPKESVKVTPNIEVIDRCCNSILTETRALDDVAKNSKQSSKSKKKSPSKKNQWKTMIEKFSITEPDFSKEIDSADCAEYMDDPETDDVPLISPNEVVLDPAMFAQPVPLFVDTPISSASILRRQAAKAGLVGLNKCALNLRQQFGFFQPEYESENILLKKEEEMVIRVLEQLNVNSKCESSDAKPNESIVLKNTKSPSAMDAGDVTLDKEATDWDADRFSINAKPYQNSYSSNNFLGHFFGDKDEKRKDLYDLRSLSLIDTTAAHILQNNGNESPEELNIEKILDGCEQESGRNSNDEEYKYIRNGPPRLRIVDAKMLEQKRNDPQSFPITAAVSHWLNQAQKEKTPDIILRMPNANRQILNVQFDDRLLLPAVEVEVKTNSQENTDVDNYSTDDSVSINNDKNKRCTYFDLPLLINSRKHDYFDSDSVDEGEDDDESLNYWESPTPITCNSNYGSGLDYENILANKNEFLCNNIANYEANDEDATKTESEQMNANIKQNVAASKAIIAGSDNFTKSPEVGCNLM